MLSVVTVRGVETILLADVAVGDVVLFGSVGGQRGRRAMRIDSVDEQRDINDSWALKGPTIDLPVAGDYSFDGVPQSENYTVGGATVTRLVPEWQVTAFLDGVAEQWGDDLTYQVGGVDNVPPETLAPERGADLRDLIPPAEALIAGNPGALEVLDQLPTGGWKVLNAGDFDQAQIGDSVVLAAEHPDVAGAWLTLSMSRRQADTWVCHATNAPVIPVPSKKVRRNGLELSFLPQEPVLAGSHDASLELTITNTSDRPWVNVAGDDDITVAWLRDNRGTRLSGSGYSHSTRPSSTYRGCRPGAVRPFPTSTC
jgi:hypothetical protein